MGSRIRVISGAARSGRSGEETKMGSIAGAAA